MADELNEVFEETMEDQGVITVPIDDTLTHSNEAADAAAVGAALRLKADKTELQSAITVNGQEADDQGAILIDGTDIPMSGTDQTTLKAKIEAVDGKTAADIKMSSAAGAKTIAQELSESESRTAEDIAMGPGSTTTLAEKIGSMDNVATANSNAIRDLQSQTGENIPMGPEDDTPVSQAIMARVKTVNGNGPDADGNVEVDHALTADNLTSANSQNSIGEWTRRTAGGSASIANGMAWLSSVRGNRVHVGYTPEVLNMTVTTAPREQGETPITAEIDRDTFVEAVSGSTTITLTYTTSWSANPATYGVTVTGDPVSGDVITIAYTAENRGTIIQSDPQTMVATGWNLYNHEVGYAIGLKYQDTATFKIEGTYTAVKFSATIDGAKTTIVPSDGLFTITANGYIWVEGGNNTDTAVYMTWADWILDGTDTWEAYTESVIDLSDVMEEYFPHGLLRVGDIRDEIDFNTGMAISNVDRLAYSAENLAQAEASGRTYEYDTDYIYLERAVALTNDIDVDGEYAVSDHGLEYFTDTQIAVYAIVIYGNNLKNKLERDVLTKSTDLVNNLTTDDATKALSAAQGKALSEQIGTLNSNLASKIDFPTYDSVTSIGVTTGTNSYSLPADGWYRAWFAAIDGDHYVEINGKSFGSYSPSIFFPAKAGTVCIMHGTSSYASYLEQYT